MTEPFVHLHTHSDHSSLDGACKVSDYVKEAKERGNPALALTDHGTMRGLFSLTEECGSDIKPIYGIEFYVCHDMNRRGLTDEEKEFAARGTATATQKKEAIEKYTKEQGVRKTWHITAWALNDTGLRNLYKLSSMAWADGYYYRPRIDVDTLCKHHEGIAVGSGCVGSMVYGHYVDGDPVTSDVTLGKLVETFGDRFYLEIMPHELEDDRQAVANGFALQVHQLTGGKHPLIATQDAHYLRHEDAEHHDTLLCIGTQSLVDEPNRFSFSGDEFWLKTRDEMAWAFGKWHEYIEEKLVEEALNNTVELAERCTAKIDIDPHRCLLPPVEIPDGFKSEFSYLTHLVTRAYTTRDLVGRAERMAKREGIKFDVAYRRYTDRVLREMKVLKKSGFVGYFLILHDLYRWVHEQGIACGPGRGSAAGSIVAYLLGITHVDPLEHRLMWERFIAPGRINMPDVDCDFDHDRRGEIIAYLRKKYGEDRVAQISTVGRMQGRQVVKDVARAYNVSFQRSNVATAQIPGDEEGAIDSALKTSELLRTFRKDYPDVIRHAQALEGMSKSVGIHAAGIVTSPVPLLDVVPLEIRRTPGSDTEFPVTAFDMRGVEGIGLLKIDILGMKTVTVLENARATIEYKVSPSGKVKFDLLDLPLDDEETLQGFTDHDFVGVFQFDSPSAHNVCNGITFHVFDDLVAVNAINRPGALDFAGEFKRRRGSKKARKHDMFHPKVTEITKDALGLMIYQEHVIRVATDVAGMTPSEADKLRKKIGKSEGYEALEEDRQKFVEGCSRTTEDMDEELADRLFDSVVKFGRYGFNRSHAVCYSMLAYWTMYLKKHYPIEFYWALMRNEPKREKVQRFARDAEDHGVPTLLQDVNVSGDEFTIDYAAGAIRGSLIEIKGVGPAAVRTITEERHGGPFKNVIDFIQRTKGKEKKVTKATVVALAKGAALDGLLPNPRWFCFEMPRLWRHVEKGEWNSLQQKIDASATADQWDEESRLREATLVNPLAIPPHPLIKFASFLEKKIRPPLEEINDELLAEPRNVFVAGAITEAEVRYVGDSQGTDADLDEETKRRIGWGRPWTRLTIEGLSGKAWAKIDWSLNDEYSEIAERDPGTPVLICAETRPAYRNLHVHFMADVEALFEKMKTGQELNYSERLFVDHPSTRFRWPSKEDKQLAMMNPQELCDRTEKEETFTAIGIVTHLYQNQDKKHRLMAWFELAGVTGVLRVVSFSSAWTYYKESIQQGRLVRVKLRKLSDGSASLLSNAGSVCVFKPRKAGV